MIFTWSFMSGSISIVRASVRQGEPRLSELAVRSVSLPSESASSRTFSRIPSRDTSDTRLPLGLVVRYSLERCLRGLPWSARGRVVRTVDRKCERLLSTSTDIRWILNPRDAPTIHERTMKIAHCLIVAISRGRYRRQRWFFFCFRAGELALENSRI